MNDEYYEVKRAAISRAIALADQAWALCQKIDAAPRTDRLFRMSLRCSARFERRIAWIHLIGMSTTGMQALNTGDTVTWRRRVLTITDWRCHCDPVYGLDGHRIWAEPDFTDEHGLPVHLPPSLWHEAV